MPPQRFGCLLLYPICLHQTSEQSSRLELGAEVLSKNQNSFPHLNSWEISFPHPPDDSCSEFPFSILEVSRTVWETSTASEWWGWVMLQHSSTAAQYISKRSIEPLEAIPHNRILQTPSSRYSCSTAPTSRSSCRISHRKVPQLTRCPANSARHSS